MLKQSEPQWVEKNDEPESAKKLPEVIKGPMLPPKEGDNWLMITEKDTDPFGALGRLFKKPNEEKKAAAADELQVKLKFQEFESNFNLSSKQFFIQSRRKLKKKES